MEKLYRITRPGACFGVLVDDKGVITRSGLPRFVGRLFFEVVAELAGIYTTIESVDA